MDIDTAFLISGLLCIPFITFLGYFFTDRKPDADGWKGFWIWLKKDLWRMLFGGSSAKLLFFLFSLVAASASFGVEAYLQME